MYPSQGPYADHGYLQMALGAYLTPSNGYKTVDPYFLSQGNWISEIFNYKVLKTNLQFLRHLFGHLHTLVIWFYFVVNCVGKIVCKIF